ncbi:MAG: hypothetical protein FWC38_06165 [Proteobacteria bacterium]|nr:hypothetical protein [Pseudomonadota bacterium]MCL2307795.1 hypothetical protein [Pseudomonadota bacterium]
MIALLYAMGEAMPYGGGCQAGLLFCNQSITTCDVYTIRRLPAFANWLDGLEDKRTRARLIRRLEKAEKGNLGDVNHEQEN